MEVIPGTARRDFDFRIRGIEFRRPFFPSRKRFVRFFSWSGRDGEGRIEDRGERREILERSKNSTNFQRQRSSFSRIFCRQIVIGRADR